LTRRPSSSFVETLQQDISESMRRILIDWLVEEYAVCVELGWYECVMLENDLRNDQVLKMESRVLNFLGFHLSVPTVRTFLSKCVYAQELTLLDYGFLRFLPSLIAASAVFLATWTLDQSGHPWNPTLEYYTCYKASNLKAGVFALHNLQMNTNGCVLNAVRDKYRQDKFKSVADLSSPKPVETLFDINNTNFSWKTLI
ncbi:hypothetical protein IFM89_011819, partial [Coptis chinensis]